MNRNRQLKRVLELIRVLERYPRRTTVQLAEQLNVSTRTVLRDIRAIEAAGGIVHRTRVEAPHPAGDRTLYIGLTFTEGPLYRRIEGSL